MCADNAQAVARICRLLDGIPLALELAAARLRMLRPDQVAERLDDRFGLLTGGGRNALRRHQTLRAAMDWSYDLLSQPERALLGRLSVFAGSFSMEAAETVGADEQTLLTSEVFELLSHLVDKSLVVVETGEREARYRLLGTVRQYAKEKLDEAGDADATARRHRDFFLRRRDEEGEVYFDEWSSLRWLGSDRENVRLALQWSLGTGDVDASLRLGAALRGYWTFNEKPVEGTAVLEQCLTLAGDTPSCAAVQVMSTLGFLYLQQGEIARAEAHLQRAMIGAESIGDAGGRAFAGGILGMAALQRGDLDRAEQLLEDCVREVQATRPEAAGWFRFNLSWVALARGDAGQAAKELKAVLAFGEATKNEGLVVHALTALAPMLALAGEHGRAEDLAAQGVEAARGLEVRRVLVMALIRGAEVATLIGAHDRAEGFLGEVLALLRNTAGHAWVADAVEMTALALGSRGRHQPATRLLGACDALRNVSGEVAEVRAIHTRRQRYQREGLRSPCSDDGGSASPFLPWGPWSEEADPAGARSVAVVLFTDLVGSTELRSRLAEGAAEELRRRHDRLLTEAVGAHGGRVVKGLGDGIMATFVGASDAVAAAVAIQQGIDRLNRSGKAAALLAVRVGISAGDVNFEEQDVHGTPVIVAARLCAAAEGGVILVADVVRVLAGQEHHYVSVGALELKGLPDPVSAVRVDWEPARVATVPLPVLLTDVGRIFVGRESELERLAQLWKEATAGERRVALLAGEPGVGKTRLAAELAIAVHEEGAVVLAGRCDEDLGVPYQPFVETLRHFVDHTSSDELEERLGRYGGELVRLLPELAERLPDLPRPLESDPETERYRLFDAVAAWLAKVSAEDPVLFVLDDLQWAAKPTLLLLRHVVRSAGGARLLVLGTYRDTELGHDHPLPEILADVRRQGGVERVSLVGLDSSGVAAFMEQAAGHALDGNDLGLARAIHEETEGNPFFVREVLRHLRETGAVERREGRWGARLPVEELGIPEGVRDVVGRRLSLLSKEANGVLRVAAVVGPELELSVLLAGEALNEEDLLSAIEEATTARLLLEVAGAAGRYRFAHALVRDTVYQDLSAARRTMLHRRVAEAIESIHHAHLDDYLPALAHHYARSSAPGAVTSKAVDYAARAGDRALVQFANDEAVAYYRQSLELLDMAEGPPDEVRRLSLLISLGEAQKRAGDSAHRGTLLDAARLAQQQGNSEILARAALANTRGHIPSAMGALDAERVEALEAALAEAGEDDSPTRARLLATLALELTFAPDRQRCLELSDEALAMARRLEHGETLAQVLFARYVTIVSPDTLSECLSNTEELVQVVAAVPDPATKCRAYSLRYRPLMKTGDAAEADRFLELADGLAVELGQPVLRYVISYVPRVGRSLIAGHLGEAERLAQEGNGIARTAGQVDAEWIFATQMFLIRSEQGRVDEVESMISGALAALAARHARLPFLEALLARVYCELNRKEAAAAVLDRLASAPPPFDLYWLMTAVHWSVAATRLGDLEQCQSLYQMLRPYCHYAVPYNLLPTASVAHHLGLHATTLERLEEAESHFVAAEETQARIGAPVYLAGNRLEWARMLLIRRGPEDAERARELLGQALATARELGLSNLERRAVELLA